MSQNAKKTLDNSAAAQAAGRELIDSALQRNPLVALGASIALPLVSLIRGRRSKPAAAVRKMKLESYSYSPVQSEPRLQKKPSEGTSNGLRTHPERTPQASTTPPKPALPPRTNAAGRRSGPPARR